MSNSGWIKLHRQIVDNWIWEDADMFKAWIDILLMVNHEDKKIYVNGKLTTIHRGEKLTSITKLSERWRWSKRRVMRFLDLLEEDEMCTTERTTYGTTLKVVNYAEYQGFTTPKRNTVDTTNVTTHSTAHVTADGTAPDTQTIMNNKSSNNANNFFSAAAQKKIPPARSDVEEYCRQKNYHIDLTEFFSYYDLHDWTLGNGRKITNWTAAVDYWSNKGKKLETNEQTDMPYYQEFDNVEFPVASNIPFENGLASEVIRRKREKVSK